MTTGLFTHAACLGHDTGIDHPETADRLRAVLSVLEGEAFALLDRRTAPPVSDEMIRSVHGDGYLEALRSAMPSFGRTEIAEGTVVSARSLEAARHAAGAAVAAVDAVLAGDMRNAFCAIRPPGHHAGPAGVMGFCLLNNAAIAAHHARERHGLERVAVVDFDVHHGNGTQDIIRARSAAGDSGTFYASIHQSPLFPGTGEPDTAATPSGCRNVALPPGANGVAFLRALTQDVLPAVEAFGPELVIVSAGFDAHRRDPLADLLLEDADFGSATQALCKLAERSCGGRLVSVLEGGYDLRALGTSIAAHVRELMAG